MSNASNLVRCWKPKPLADHLMGNFEYLVSHKLERSVKNEQYVSVTFTTVKDHPEWMGIHSSNWSREDEVHGIFDINECRKFYKTLLKAGFVLYKKEL